MSFSKSIPRDDKELAIDEPSVEEVNPTAHAVDSVTLNRALRKVDYRLLPVLGLLYLFSYLDRSSLASASIFGYKKSLGITTTQYNLIATVFFFSYGLFEVPSNIVLSYVKPSLWIGIICASWGLVMTLSGIVQNFTGAMIARFFLGVTEAGFFPAALVLVGNWYPRERLQTRISAFYALGVFSGAFSGLLAYAINYMDGVGGLESWRWIFILEGMATVVLSTVVFLCLPNDPRSSKFLTAEESDVIEASCDADGNGGHAHFQWKYLRDVVKDYKIYACTYCAGSVNIIAFGFSYTLPTILTQLGYKAAQAQLLTIPVYTVACICTLSTAYISDRIGKRHPMIIAGFSVALVGLVMLYALPKDRLPGVRYFACLVMMGGIYGAFPGIITWNSNNAESKGKRNISMAFMMTIASLATAAGTNSYLGREAPYYTVGFSFSIAMCASSILVAAALAWSLKRENRKLDRIQAEYEQRGEPITPEISFRYIL